MILLLAANLGFLAWSRGWLGDLLPPPEEKHEPERLAWQVQPQRILLGPASASAVPASAPEASPAPPEAPASAASTASSPPASATASDTAAVSAAAALASAAAGIASTPTVAPAALAAPAPAARKVCLQAGIYTAAEFGRVQPLLRSTLPSGSWRVEEIERPGSFAVYLGRFPNRDALLRRKQELRRQKIDVIELRLPGEREAGLSLGRFRARDKAEQHLETLEKRRGVRGARVISTGAPVTAHLVVLPAADARLQQLSEGLASRLPRGRGFRPCSDAAARR